MTTVAPVVPGPATQQFVEATANPPCLGPAGRRKAVDEVQSGEIVEPAEGYFLHKAAA